jgi:outer membrane protein OmpA-like peptidoglycan-associated protein
MARDFVLYFDPGQNALTPASQTLVQAAADLIQSGHAAQVVITGYSDTSVGIDDAMRLSQSRAKSVADGLTALGVPAAILSIDSKGKTDLAVQTPDGVVEPLNNRVTITVSF